ncbi:hypothetical protein ABTQ09_04080 [Acinetobacter baumannii]|uniref:hypothetical protein n=1 Tax=Acinetobacter baumannii TaxID=470 RepID=UPI000355547B|nr:hypothetical protein [Acinetobacter baumannii]AGQ07087.1 hypothetical protein BJAB0715_02441 [Acinetobacter baumannii BJAB0715]AMN02051.1 hypothetical protein AZE33_12825 [Acinetobacter baumannii]MDB0262889.1 hypothetical protein [Acinetobacter baumannii]MDB0307770.1 hypothetical protein [Acinetobacter baumannii]MVO51343.1 hypothetical protein [Acinetobacter baumannii]
MSNPLVEEAQLNDCTLRALVNSLQLQGYDLDKILNNFESEITGNVISGSSPQYKSAAVELLKERINEARSNSLLGKG